jgi:hypothetical protein
MSDMEERMDASGGEYYIVDNEYHTVTRGSDHKKLDLTPGMRRVLENEENQTLVFDRFFREA